MEYQILESSHRGELASLFRAYVREGWEPQGGVAAISNGHGVVSLYLQAMIRTEENRVIALLKK